MEAADSDGTIFRPECMSHCPQLGACTQRAIAEHALNGTPISDAFSQAVTEAQDLGLLPTEGCTGLARTRLQQNSMRARDGVSNIEGAGAHVLGVDPWGRVIVRVCSAAFDK